MPTTPLNPARPSPLPGKAEGPRGVSELSWHREREQGWAATISIHLGLPKPAPADLPPAESRLR